ERQLLSTLIRCANAGRDAGGDEVFLKVQMHRSQYGQSTHGVAYTRNPFTGKKDIYGVYQAPGSEKKHTLEPGEGETADGTTLREKNPAVYALFKRYLPEIEACYRDVMEVEFVTDEDGHLTFTGFDKANTTAK